MQIFKQRFDRNHAGRIDVICGPNPEAAAELANLCKAGLIVETKDQRLLEIFGVAETGFGRDPFAHVDSHRFDGRHVYTLRLREGSRVRVLISEEEFPFVPPNAGDPLMAALIVIKPEFCEALAIQPGYANELIWLREHVAGRLEKLLNASQYEVRHTAPDGSVTVLGSFEAVADALEEAARLHPECCFVDDDFETVDYGVPLESFDEMLRDGPYGPVIQLSDKSPFR